MNDVARSGGNHRRHGVRAAAAAMATAMVVLVACSSGGSSKSGASQAGSAAPGASANPDSKTGPELPPPPAVSDVEISQGQIDKAVGSIDATAKDLLKRTGVPGLAVAVVHDDKVVYSKGFGVRDVRTKKPVDTKTVFQLASVSKSVGSSVVAGAVGEGKVSWDDPVAKYLPGFTLKDPYVGSHVTIADMYAHRSGLPDHAGDLLEDLGYGRDDVLHKLALEPLDPWRISYHYTNFGLTAGAQAVANASGTSWEDLSQKVLYGPLGMTSTSSRHADFVKAPDHAVLHVKVGNRWEPKFDRQPDAQSPAGGVSSNVVDLAKWMRMELAHGTFGGKKVIDEKALLETWVPQIATGPPDPPFARTGFYGLGMDVSYDPAGRLRVSHSGAFADGAATAFTMLPSENLGIIALTNGAPIGVPEALNATFMDRVETGKVTRDWFTAYQPLFASLSENPSELAGKKPPASPKPAQPETAYVGTYANDYYGPARVENKDGKLLVVLGPKNQAFPLSHWDGNTFSYEPTGENAVGISAVTFTTAPDGHATQMVVEPLDETGLGTFTRP